MAESPSHKFGQIIGDLLEELIHPVLDEFCKERLLYLDRHGKREGVRKGKKVSWEDKYGNLHDLDFVIEKEGSSRELGRPVAFIEAAWRRYTKHSRNKAQEIQGAVLPIKEKFQWDQPFLGAVLAGEFTQGALDQLKSVGFEVLYIEYNSIINAFASVGINAKFDESTPDIEFKECVNQIDELDDTERQKLKDALIQDNKDKISNFFEALVERLDRIIDRILIFPLFGQENTFTDITSAFQFLEGYDEIYREGGFKEYEVIIRYNNGNTVNGKFNTKKAVLNFLKYVAQ